jgi:hypothetical protein
VTRSLVLLPQKQWCDLSATLCEEFRKTCFLTAPGRTANLPVSKRQPDVIMLGCILGFCIRIPGPQALLALISRFVVIAKDSLNRYYRSRFARQCLADLDYGQRHKIRSASPEHVFLESWRQLRVSVSRSAQRSHFCARRHG